MGLVSQLKTSPHLKTVFIFCLLSLSVLFLYRDVATFDFVNFDDGKYVSNNYNIQEGLTTKSIAWAFQTMRASNWHPLTWISYMVDIEIFGKNPGGHHVTNTLLHLVNTLLLFFVLKKMTSALYKSFFVALLFAIHPLHIESVAWISERKDLLCSLFWFMCLGMYLSYARKPGNIKYCAIFSLFLLGLLAKPMIVTLPFVLLLLDYWPLARISDAWAQYGGEDKNDTVTRPFFLLIVEKTPLFLLSFASCLVTYYAQSMGRAVTSLEHLPILFKIANILVNYGEYLKKIICPTELSFFYPYTNILYMGDILGSGAILIVLTLFVIKKAGVYPFLPVGWFLFLGMLVPVIGIVQVGAQRISDRYMYLPSIGLFILFIWGGDEFMKRHQKSFLFAFPFLGSILFLFLFISNDQVQVWANSVSLFKHAISVNSRNYLAHDNLGIALRQQGKEEEALLHFKKAVDIKQNYAEGYINYGHHFFNLSQYNEALKYYQKAIQVRPDSMKGHLAMTAALIRLQKNQEARTHINMVLSASPAHQKALYYLGIISFQEDKFEEAQRIFFRLLEINPFHYSSHLYLAFINGIKKDFKKAHFHIEKSRTLGFKALGDRSVDLGTFLTALNKKEEAKGYYLYMAKRQPVSSFHMLLNFGTLLSEMGNQADAIEQFSKALNVEPENLVVLNTIVEFYERLETFDKTIPYYKKIIKLNPNSAEAYYNLGYSFFKNGNNQEALVRFKEAIQINPNYNSKPYK